MVLSGIKTSTKGKKGSIAILLDRTFLHSHNLFSAARFFRSCISEKRFYWNFLRSSLQKQRLRIFLKLFQIIFWQTNFQNELQATKIFSRRSRQKDFIWDVFIRTRIGIVSFNLNLILSKPLTVVFQHKVEWFLYILVQCFCDIEGTSLYWTNLTMIYFVDFAHNGNLGNGSFIPFLFW